MNRSGGDRPTGWDRLLADFEETTARARAMGPPDRLASNFIHGIKRMPCKFTPRNRAA